MVSLWIQEMIPFVRSVPVKFITRRSHLGPYTCYRGVVVNCTIRKVTLMD